MLRDIPRPEQVPPYRTDETIVIEQTQEMYLYSRRQLNIDMLRTQEKIPATADDEIGCEKQSDSRSQRPEVQLGEGTFQIGGIEVAQYHYQSDGAKGYENANNR